MFIIRKIGGGVLGGREEFLAGGPPPPPLSLSLTHTHTHSSPLSGTPSPVDDGGGPISSRQRWHPLSRLDLCMYHRNGETLAQLLGFDEYIPPFATATDKEILTGVNYGSGGAGIRNETGYQLGARISLSEQLLNHQSTVSRTAILLGSKEAAANYLNKCLYYVGIGSNDYINNYLLPQYYNTSYLYTPEQYAVILIQQYARQLRLLYKYGARKVAVFGLGEIGCTPAEMASYGTNGSACVTTIDDDVKLFNEGLNSLVDELNSNLTDAKFIYVNITEISSGNASEYGIAVTNAPCCKVSSNTGKGECVPSQVPCSNRTIYAYYDGFHPTDVTNELLGAGSYDALTSLISITELGSNEGINVL